MKSTATEWFDRLEVAAAAAASRRSGGHRGNQLDRYGVRLAVAHTKRCLNIGPSGIPNRGARC